MDSFIKLVVVLLIAGGGYFFFVEKTTAVDPDDVFADWYSDYDGYQTARAEAVETGKPLIVYFYTDW